MDELTSLDHKVVEIYGSEENAHRFLSDELKKIRMHCFDGEYDDLDVEFRPMMAREISSDFNKKSGAGAEYIPAGLRGKPVIVVYSNIMIRKELVPMVLAHELTHHWVHVNQLEFTPIPPVHPSYVDDLIKKHFTDESKECLWRAHGHSSFFLMKAVEVAQKIKVPVMKFLGVD